MVVRWTTKKKLKKLTSRLGFMVLALSKDTEHPKRLVKISSIFGPTDNHRLVCGCPATFLVVRTTGQPLIPNTANMYSHISINNNKLKHVLNDYNHRLWNWFQTLTNGIAGIALLPYLFVHDLGTVSCCLVWKLVSFPDLRLAFQARIRRILTH